MQNHTAIILIHCDDTYLICLAFLWKYSTHHYKDVIKWNELEQYCSDAKLLSEPFYWKLIFFLHKMAGWFDGDVKCYLCICYLRLSHQNSNFKSKTNKRFFFALNPKIRLELYIHSRIVSKGYASHNKNNKRTLFESQILEQKCYTFFIIYQTFEYLLLMMNWVYYIIASWVMTSLNSCKN